MIVEENGFSAKNIELFGSKFMTGNGYMGYRGTLEEFSSKQLVACTLSELFDKNADKWREPVNALNPFFIKSRFNGVELDTITGEIAEHKQTLDISNGLHSRETVFKASDSLVTVNARRFVSHADFHVMALEYKVSSSADGVLNICAMIDSDIWDINGPHLCNSQFEIKDGCVIYSANTIELSHRLAIAQNVCCDRGDGVCIENGRQFEFNVKAGEEIIVYVYASVYKSIDLDLNGDVSESAFKSVMSAKEQGYEALLDDSTEAWEQIWEDVAVDIVGDEKAQLSLRYSMYLLLISTPFHTDRVAIPARGLSGQVYKGAMFWDTEIYMLPMFNYCLPKVCRNLVMYRVHTLEGARKKAVEYGYRGAFYAWESQETGDDSCTEYNINDIFTGRPIRTYFRDKQVHISADVAYGLWEYYKMAGDDSVLLDGGAEVILECARFLYSYSYYKPDKQRYEMLDVTGADEYHERVNNNAYTNVVTKVAIDAAISVVAILSERYDEFYCELMSKLDFENELDGLRDFADKLFVPTPDEKTGVIEQFDGYFKLEDVRPADVLARVIKENEYLGSPCGLAVNTQMIKQADVVLVNALFRDDYTKEQKLSNWEYYEPRTEHGSSLSTCIYALAAANCKMTEWAYKYFMKASSIDLLGGYKLYVGDQYIGGTHPAANGGSWMVAILGFAGLSADENKVTIKPALPKSFNRMEFPLCYKGQKFKVAVSKDLVDVTADESNTKECGFAVGDDVVYIRAGTSCIFGAY